MMKSIVDDIVPPYQYRALLSVCQLHINLFLKMKDKVKKYKKKDQKQ